MDSLFDMTPTNTYEPLPVRMRPTKLDHLYGQEKAIGKGTFLRAMVEKLSLIHILPDNTMVYPGHGPETNIGYEKQYNPFVGQ